MRLPPTPRAPRLSRSGLILALYAGMAVVAVAWGALRGHPDIYRIAPGTPTRMLINLLAGFGFGVAVVGLSRVAAHHLSWARMLHQEFRHLLGPLSSREILILAVASSVGEEFFFRGALLPHLGLWVSSALFALPHIGPGVRFLPWTLTSFVIGLGMGALMLAGGDLGGPIAAHFTINFLNLHYIAKNDLADAL